MLYSYSVILVLIGCWLAFASAVPTVSRADDDDAQIGGENSALLATLIADAVERRFASIGFGTANAVSPRRAVAASTPGSPLQREAIPHDDAAAMAAIKTINRYCTGFSRVGSDFHGPTTGVRTARQSVHATIPSLTTDDWTTSRCAVAVREAVVAASATSAIIPSSSASPALAGTPVGEHAPFLRFATADHGACLRLLRGATLSGRVLLTPAAAVSSCVAALATALELEGESSQAATLRSLLPVPRHA